MKQEHKHLVKEFGKNKAEELIKLTKNFDNYVKKFKENVNSLLDEKGYEVVTGVSFVKKGTFKKEE